MEEYGDGRVGERDEWNNEWMDECMNEVNEGINKWLNKKWMFVVREDGERNEMK